MPITATAPFREDVIVIGAGPSGLCASLTLCRLGRRPLLLERSEQVGGLMRSLRWGDFTVDLGRKELYTRFSEVDALWSELLGDGYVPYPHRVGSLYRGRILELSGRYRGMLRGIPIPWLVSGGVSMLGGWLTAAGRTPASYEDHWHGRVGRVFAGLLAQGYWEKFRGRRWSEMAPPEPDAESVGGRSASLEAVRQALRLARRGGVQSQAAWRHPVHGTGQLFEAMHREISALGGRVCFHADVRSLRHLPNGDFEVESEEAGGPRRRIARHLISSAPIERLAELLGWPARNPQEDEHERRRSVVLVYLFLRAAPRFPHAWLEVNDPNMSIGRVTSYGAFSAGMVPTGSTALCVEFFCQADDRVIALGDENVTRLAVEELGSAQLIDPACMIGSLVWRLPRTNAAASWREQQTEQRQALLAELTRYRNLFHVNRPGSDWASLAGMLAAQAICTGDRATFDMRADPTKRHSDEPVRPANARAGAKAGYPAPSTR